MPEEIFNLRDIIKIMPSNPDVLKYIQCFIKKLRESDKYDTVSAGAASILED